MVVLQGDVCQLQMPEELRLYSISSLYRIVKNWFFHIFSVTKPQIKSAARDGESVPGCVKLTCFPP